MGLDEVVLSKAIDLIDDTETDGIDDRSELEMMFQPDYSGCRSDQHQIHQSRQL